MVVEAPILGRGIYTVSEAAFYARMHTATLTRWLHGSTEGKAVLRPESSDERIVTFNDFVDALAIRAIRLEHKVPLPKIRQAVKTAEDKYGVGHPFARKHVTYLYNKDIYIRLPGDSETTEEQYVQISGKHSGAQLIFEVHLEDIGFDIEGLAKEYSVFQWSNKTVRMDPRVHFGEPMLPSGYSFLTIRDAVTSEGSADNAAKAYGVSIEEVSLACRCYDHLIGLDGHAA